MADQILEELPPRNNFGELLAKLNRDVAQLNAHYENSRWLADIADHLDTVTVDQMTLTLDVANRRFRIDPGKLLGIQHLGQIAEFLQGEETATGMDKIVIVAESVREIYDLVFPRNSETGSTGTHADEIVQPVQYTKSGK